MKTLNQEKAHSSGAQTLISRCQSVIDTPLRMVLRRAGVTPFSNEKLEAHRNELLRFVEQPKNSIQAFILGKLARSESLQRFIDQAALIITATQAFCLGSSVIVCLSILLCKCFGYLSSTSYFPWITIAFLSLVALLGTATVINYLVGLTRYTIVEWARFDAYPWSQHLPAYVQDLISELDFHSRKAGVTGIKYRVEFPLCEKIEDPILFVCRSDGANYEEYAITAWT